MTIGICNDHAGVDYKNRLVAMLEKAGFKVVNFGTDSTVSVDYPVFAHALAEGTEYERELKLLESIERLSPTILRDVKGTSKDMCANVDMYSGFVYSMLGIPEELFTPLFACARMAGWAAHRFEEVGAGKRIIRPAYKATFRTAREYLPMEER